VKKNKDTYGIYPPKFASSTQKHKKVIETPNQQIKIKKFVWGLPDGICRLHPKP
jgi:hypothetical protein